MVPKIFSASFAVCTLTLVSAMFTGCGSSNHVQANPNSPSPTPGGPSNPSPSSATFSVTGIVPASGTTQVALNSTIQITFSSAATASTVNSSNIKVTDPNVVAGAVSYNSSSNTATFTPSAQLVANSTYTVTVNGVTGANGASLANAFTSNFATASSSGTGSSGNTTLQYQATLLNSNGTAVSGQISVDTSGNVTIELSGGAASTSYAVSFCPAEDPTAPAAANVQCLSIGTLTTNASGAANSTYKFPQPGNWAGDFSLMTSGSSSPQFSTYLVGNNTPPKGQVYMSTLEPQSTTNGKGVLTQNSTQDPLKSGTVTYSSTTQEVTFSLTGGLANASYYTSETETTYIDGSGSYTLDNLTTNASGNGSVTTQLDGIGGDLFQVGPNQGPSSGQYYAGYIGGFSVPNNP